jgi:poly-gamma-glutamate capsule biosynthesis protein CapA/YwtB (metallophosphatase superfamily)
MRTRGDKSTGFRRPFLVYSFPIYPFLVYSFLIYPFLIYLCLTLPGEPAPPTLTLAFVGDVMLGRGVAQALDGDWDAAFVDVQPWLAQADLAFANLESPLTTAPFVFPSDGMLGRYDLRAPPEAVAALRAAGVDVVSLANNHALDAGPVGLSQTMTTLGGAGIAGLVDDGRIYPSTHLPMYCLLAFDDSVEPLDEHAAAAAVTAAADEGGLVIVSVHWGGEYQASPSPRQRAVARALAHAGADLVAGHGPHVLQRVEWVGETLVAYSLGNFLFDQPYPADCRWGAVLRVVVRDDRIVAVDALPTVVQRGRVRRAASEDAAAILARLALDPVSGIQYQ